MVGVGEAEQPARCVGDHIFTEREHAGDLGVERGGDVSSDGDAIRGAVDFVDEEEEFGDFETAGDVDGDCGALIVLLIGAQYEEQGVADRDLEESFFVQTGVGVDDQDVEA